MPRKPVRSRKMPRPALSEALRFFLTTGAYCASLMEDRGVRGPFPEYAPGEKVRLFLLGGPNPTAQAELRRVWLTFRAEILADWKQQRRREKPWAEKVFGQPGPTDDTH